MRGRGPAFVPAAVAAMHVSVSAGQRANLPEHGKPREDNVRRMQLMAVSGLLLGTTALMPASAFAATCAQLATDPANGLAGNATIVSPTATLVPAAGTN